MFQNIIASRALRTSFLIILVVYTALLITNTVHAAFFTIIIGDGAVDVKWNEPFIWDDLSDGNGMGDIVHAYFATNGTTPTAFSFRLEGSNMVAGAPSSIQVGMDCNANGNFGETVDRFVMPNLYPWGGEVFDGTGQSVGVFDIRIETIGTTNIEWTASSTLANWGECSMGSIYIKFYSPTGDTTAVRGYNVASGEAITTITTNHIIGAPGSFINLTGEGFPPNQTGTITINGQIVGNIPIDNDGEFIFTLTTSDADEGAYIVVVSVNPSASTSFRIDNSADTRLREGIYPTVEVPAGIAFTHEIYLPLVQR